MLGLNPWVSVLAVLVAAAIARVLPPLDWRAGRRLLEGRGAPALLGITGALLSMWVWRTMSRTPVMHDESAYLLQAELFARLRWTGSVPGVPAFFQQMYILVDPVLASKYPPGNSLVLALGTLIGAPALPIIIMSGCTSALIYLVARRLAGGVTALLTWLIWQSCFPILFFRTSYLSEGVTGLAWMATWWGILHWRDGAGRRWLVLAAAAAAWCIISRPLTGVALGVAALACVLWHCKRTGAWRDLAPALGMATAILAIVPLWSWRTTGKVTLTPLTAYTREFVPFDKPGFGVTSDEKPSARLPRDQWLTSAAFYLEHKRHTVRALPMIAWRRLTMIDRDAWYEWRGGLRLFAVIGLLALTADGWIGVAAFALQFLLYLSYAHPDSWTAYYLEDTPVLAFVAALGIATALRRVLDRGGKRRSTAGALLVAAALGLALVITAPQVRQQIDIDHAYYDSFARVIASIPDSAVVFVRYKEDHPDAIAFVRNPVDFNRAKVWTVYDRGAANERLLAIAPNRAGYLFDEATWTLRPLQRAPSVSVRDSLRVVPAGSARELRGVQRPH